VKALRESGKLFSGFKKTDGNVLAAQKACRSESGDSAADDDDRIF
jgi:hypothetical protein